MHPNHEIIWINLNVEKKIENNRPSLASVNAEKSAAISIQEWPKSCVTPQWWASHLHLPEPGGGSTVWSMPAALCNIAIRISFPAGKAKVEAADPFLRLFSLHASATFFSLWFSFAEPFPISSKIFRNFFPKDFPFLLGTQQHCISQPSLQWLKSWPVACGRKWYIISKPTKNLPWTTLFPSSFRVSVDGSEALRGAWMKSGSLNDGVEKGDLLPARCTLTCKDST